MKKEQAFAALNGALNVTDAYEEYAQRLRERIVEITNRVFDEKDTLRDRPDYVDGVLDTLDKMEERFAKQRKSIEEGPEGLFELILEMDTEVEPKAKYWWPAAEGFIDPKMMGTRHICNCMRKLTSELGLGGPTLETDQFRVRWLGIFQEILAYRLGTEEQTAA